MELYCGIDLHSTNSVVSIIDERDRLVFEKRLPNQLPRILEALAPYQRSLVGCVVESTYNWYWLVDGLMAAGYCTHLANTTALHQYDGLKHGDDFTDARHLAHVLRLGILPEGYIYPRDKRAIRDLLRRRLGLVRQRTVQILSLQSMVTRHTAQRLTTNATKSLTDDAIKALFGEPLVMQGARFSRDLIQHFDDAITELEKEVHKQMRRDVNYQLLTTIPGVGRMLGLTIALETGDVSRFAGPGQYASYARCVKSERISNGKRKGEGNRKNGNRYLAWAFFEAGHFAMRFEPKIKRYYERKRARTHPMIASKAVAHKLARAAYHMMRNETPFDLQRAFA